jgi:hypothetical protein
VQRRIINLADTKRLAHGIWPPATRFEQDYACAALGRLQGEQNACRASTNDTKISLRRYSLAQIVSINNHLTPHPSRW